MESWERFEALVAAVVPDGLRSPARAEDLDALEVPPDWRHLWARHDGQSTAIGGVFEGWFFLPLRGVVDSVEAESDDDWLVVAKDFGCGTWAVAKTGGPLVESLDGETRLVARNFIDLLERMADAFEAALPEPWVEGPDGRSLPQSAPTRVAADPVVADRVVADRVVEVPAETPAVARPSQPIVPAETERTEVLTAVASSDADGWSADVHARPEHGGGLVEIRFASELRALRLPPTLRDGMAGTFDGAAPDGRRLRLQVHLRAKMPPTPQETP